MCDVGSRAVREVEKGADELSVWRALHSGLAGLRGRHLRLAELKARLGRSRSNLAVGVLESG